MSENNGSIDIQENIKNCLKKIFEEKRSRNLNL